MAKWIRRLAIPIILGWLAVIGVLTVFVPPLDVVGEMRAVSLSPKEAPSVIALMRNGKVFEESDSDNAVMIVLEGAAATRCGGAPVLQRADRQAARRYQARAARPGFLGGDPLTEAGALSADGKAVYVQVSLAGNMGESLGNESVAAVQTIVKDLPPPPGVKTFVTGGSAMQTDQQKEGGRSIQVVKIATVTVIICMLLFFYRSITTVGVVLVILVMGLSVTQGGGGISGLPQPDWADDVCHTDPGAAGAGCHD